VAHAADQEDPNHVLGAGLKMSASVGQSPRICFAGPADPVAQQQFAQRQPGKAHPHVGKKSTATASHASVVWVRFALHGWISGANAR